MLRSGVELKGPTRFDYVVGNTPQIWWRISLVNHGKPVAVVVRLADVEPPAKLAVPDCRLHRAGDDPPDGKYSGETTLQHGEPAWYDVVSMAPKVPGAPDSAVVSTSHAQVTVSSASPWPLPVEFAIRTVDRPDYRDPVALDGTYRFAITAHFGDHSTSRIYTVRADPAARILTMT